MNEENKVIDNTDAFLSETEPETAEITENTEPDAEPETEADVEAKSEETAEPAEKENLEAAEAPAGKKLSLSEKIAAHRSERRLKAVKQKMDNSINGRNYMSFIPRSSHPVFITEEKKDEYRSMHRLGRARIILGGIILLLAVTAVIVFAVDNMKTTEELPISDNTVEDVPVVLPRDDFEPVSYDPETGLAEYDDDFNLFIVNESNPLPEDYVIKTEEYMGIEVDEKIVSALSLMVSDIQAAGMDISFERGYISYEEQKQLYEDEVAKLMKKGSTYLMAQHNAGENVDIPGLSDYHTGLSVKLQVNKNYEESKLYKWLSSHAADYGFVFRYPEGKSASTGGEDLSVLRYVGHTNAVRMRQLSMCLEEYEEYLGSR